MGRFDHSPPGAESVELKKKTTRFWAPVLNRAPPLFSHAIPPDPKKTSPPCKQDFGEELRRSADLPPSLSTSTQPNARSSADPPLPPRLAAQPTRGAPPLRATPLLSSPDLSRAALRNPLPPRLLVSSLGNPSPPLQLSRSQVFKRFGGGTKDIEIEQCIDLVLILAFPRKCRYRVFLLVNQILSPALAVPISASRYRVYHNNVQESKLREKGAKFYDFHHNTRFVTSTRYMT
ncbi:hypothetical protein FCM35_KLT17377 [Carex littledalei]|uniref:Uncharacterized protein n=1 Tax=Carex littledalei TaxID=544730 RepID=A0A833QYN8_9POAL|nr:hypothetical protein FCM35_KLT17377 [Carex littledalei]